MLALKCSILNRYFSLIEVGDIPSIQCKMSLSGPNSMRKVDGLSLMFIDFYVPALTLRNNSTEISLLLSESITLYAVCHIYAGAISKET
jgi:hypothetical protein